MKDEKTLAHINLHAVLPLIGELVSGDAEAGAIARGWRCSFRFAVRGGPAAFIQFRDGKATAVAGKGRFPSVGFWFPSHGKLNAMFRGKGLPVLWTGFWNVGALRGFSRLAKRLEQVMRPTEEMLKDAKTFKLHVRMTLYAMTRGIKAVGENDPEVSPLVVKARNGVAQFEVLPDGPATHVVLSDGRLEARTGRAERANCYMKFADAGVLHELALGGLDAYAALGNGSIRLEGYIPLIDTLNAALDRLGEYME
ncbi:MAG: SCP2 sterol-binding domain-containing protein [bacterium]